MKKLLLALLAVSVLGFSSCSDDNDESSSTETETEFDTEDFQGEILDGEDGNSLERKMDENLTKQAEINSPFTLDLDYNPKSSNYEAQGYQDDSLD